MANKKPKNITGKKVSPKKNDPKPTKKALLAKKPAAKKAAPVKKAVSKTTEKNIHKSAPQLAVQNKAPVKPAKKAAAKETKLKNLQEYIRDKVVEALDGGKAEDIMCIDVREQSALTDFLVICSGKSARQVKALSDNVQKTLYECGAKKVRSEGAAAGDWAVVDGGDVIVHIFRPEVRSFYRLEEVWGLEPPLAQTFKDL